MGIKIPYIAELKEGTGLSWSDLEEKTGYPQTTLRDHLTGRVARPNPQILAAVVTAMGGDVSKVAGYSAEIRKDMSEVQQIEEEGTEDLKLTIRTMRVIRNEMLAMQKESYERQIAQIEKSHTEEVTSLTVSVKMLRSALISAVAAIVVILVAIICVLGVAH